MSKKKSLLIAVGVVLTVLAIVVVAQARQKNTASRFGAGPNDACAYQVLQDQVPTGYEKRFTDPNAYESTWLDKCDKLWPNCTGLSYKDTTAATLYFRWTGETKQAPGYTFLAMPPEEAPSKDYGWDMGTDYNNREPEVFRPIDASWLPDFVEKWKTNCAFRDKGTGIIIKNDGSTPQFFNGKGIGAWYKNSPGTTLRYKRW